MPSKKTGNHKKKKAPSQGNQRARRYSSLSESADTQIQDLLSAFEDPFDRTLLAEMMSSVYRLGAEQASTIDLKILNSVLKELRYAFGVFGPYRNVRKVAIFGSARTPQGQPSYQMAEEFGKLIVQAGWMVITGAASGIMKAGHEGAGRKASFGLNIRLPFEQEANSVIAKDEKLVNCKYFFTRKLLFIKESSATVLFPGGFGTLDEGFENLTLVQTGKSEPRPIVFVDLPQKSFWGPLIDFLNQDMVSKGMISDQDRSIFQVAHSAQEAVKILQHFYSTYHSMRYVGEQLVLRLNQPLPKEAVDQLSEEFKEITQSGSIEQRKALEEEKQEQGDEPELVSLPRLVFHFDQQDYGRLFQLIHRVNDLGAANPLRSGRKNRLQ